MLLRDLSHFRLSITKLHIKKLDGTASLALSEGVVDKEEVSNNNNNDDQSLAKAVWRSLNPSDKEQPILTAKQDGNHTPKLVHSLLLLIL